MYQHIYEYYLQSFKEKEAFKGEQIADMPYPMFEHVK